MEVVRLIEDGFLDVTVRRLQAQHPAVAADVEDARAAGCSLIGDPGCDFEKSLMAGPR